MRTDVKTPSDSVWNKEDWLQQWKESVSVPICKKDDKADCCNNYRAISVLSTA
jgi:hypothetical protein